MRQSDPYFSRDQPTLGLFGLVFEIWSQTVVATDILVASLRGADPVGLID